MAAYADSGLSELPFLGPVLFNQTSLTYLCYVAVPVVYVVLYKTRWGLRVRAVGEHPGAADTVGIKVDATRYGALIVAGTLAGMGGAFFTIGFVNQLQQQIGLLETPIPQQVLQMLPYLATIIAVAGLVGRVRAPAADGEPYVKGE